jgi:hypothetical protein
VDPSKAVKLFVRLAEEPGPNELANLQAQATGLFRRTYQQWADNLGEKVTSRVVSAPSSTSTPPANTKPS